MGAEGRGCHLSGQCWGCASDWATPLTTALFPTRVRLLIQVCSSPASVSQALAPPSMDWLLSVPSGCFLPCPPGLLACPPSRSLPLPTPSCGQSPGPTDFYQHLVRALQCPLILSLALCSQCSCLRSPSGVEQWLGAQAVGPTQVESLGFPFQLVAWSRFYHLPQLEPFHVRRIVALAR